MSTPRSALKTAESFLQTGTFHFRSTFSCLISFSYCPYFRMRIRYLEASVSNSLPAMCTFVEGHFTLALIMRITSRDRLERASRLAKLINMRYRLSAVRLQNVHGCADMKIYVKNEQSFDCYYVLFSCITRRVSLRHMWWCYMINAAFRSTTQHLILNQQLGRPCFMFSHQITPTGCLSI